MTHLTNKLLSSIQPFNRFILALYIILASLVFWSGLPAVPFHPDESTYLFMSADVDQFFKSPFSLAWRPGAEIDLRMRYRMLDAPLARDAIALARWITGEPPLTVDWNWSASWEVNLSAGSVPPAGLLIIGRMGVAVFYPFSLLLIYLVGKTIAGKRVGWLALILLSLNPLVLLHTRRAMAESLALFTLLLSLWAIITRKPTWLVAVMVGLAFSAKHSTLSIALVALTVLTFKDAFQLKSIGKMIAHAILFGAGVVITTLLLNPYLWVDPFRAFSLSIALRQDLLSRQVDAIGALAQNQILTNLPERILALVANLVLTPPAISDVGNYDSALRASSAAYLANPLHHLFRDPISASIGLALASLGLGWMVRNILRTPTKRLGLSVVVGAGLAQFASLAVTVPLPFQRYALPLVPYFSLYLAFSLDFLLRHRRLTRKIEDSH